MNGKMWLHPATQRNVAQLTADGCHFIGPVTGELACGYEGIGRLAPMPEILTRVEEFATRSSPL
jgi:phosphopantothenoylcysteine synthetase/decarboxylase